MTLFDKFNERVEVDDKSNDDKYLCMLKNQYSEFSKIHVSIEDMKSRLYAELNNLDFSKFECDNSKGEVVLMRTVLPSDGVIYEVMSNLMIIAKMEQDIVDRIVNYESMVPSSKLPPHETIMAGTLSLGSNGCVVEYNDNKDGKSHIVVVNMMKHIPYKDIGLKISSR